MIPKGVFSPFDEPDADGVPASPVLITPVRQKKYDTYQATINSLWAQSADLFATAKKVVIVGYSFPSTDDRAVELLGSALTARPGEMAVEVVAPDAEAIASRIGEGPLSNAKIVALHNMKFEQYLGVLANDMPSLMKKAAAEYEEVREWVERIYALSQAASYPIEPE